MKIVRFTKGKILFAIISLAIILRFYQLGANPPSLYWDEASLGYNAFSILKSGADEHGRQFPLTNFAAFGDYKPPLYIYSAVPAIALFDLSPFAVRLPSAIFGLLTILVTYLLAKKIFLSEKAALLSAFLLAVSPWHLQFSRAAFEGNLALFFSVLGIYLFFKIKDGKYFLGASLLMFLAAMYTFTGQRLFVPFVIIILAWQFRNEIKKQIPAAAISSLAALIIFAPLFIFSTKTIEGKLRFDEVTIFKDLKPINDSIKARELDNFSPLSSVVHNRRVYFAHEYLQNYFDAFNPTFLFFKGDVNPRLSTQTTGQLYYFELPLLLAGAFFLIKNKLKYAFFIFCWLLISPIGPATARETPHALRMVHILPTFQLIGAYGALSLLRGMKLQKITLLAICFLALVCIFNYLHDYYIHYPKAYSGEWQYGYRQAVEISDRYHGDVDNILVSNHQGRSYIYFLFFNKVDPQAYLSSAKIVKDDFFFYNVYGFGKYTFFGATPGSYPAGKSLLIHSPNSLPGDAQKIETITNLNGFPVYDVGIINR